MHAGHRVSVLLLVTVMAANCSRGQAQKPKDDSTLEVRAPAVAGRFYPAGPDQLRREIQGYLDRAPDVKPTGTIYAAMAPHAGYVFSGAIAARTHKVLAAADFDTLVIIGHDSYRGAVAYVTDVDAFATPLGNMPVDREMVKKILAFNSGIKADASAQSGEHSVEVQLPFLQVLNRKCKIVPVLFGNPTVANCKIFADAILAAAGDRKVVVLSSTDMSHYPPYDMASKLDKSSLEVIRSMDIQKIFDHLTKPENAGTIPNLQTALCSRGGLGTAMLYAKARGANTAEVLGYANSGDAPVGDKDGVVGYGSVVFFKREPVAQP